jgi:hypothetical protein
MTCDELRALAPELALNAVTGTERADALAHLVGCGSCQEYVEELAAIADGLLLLAPEDEPPAGFESRVLGRAGRVSRRRWAIVASIAAALVLAAGVGGVVARQLDRRELGVNQDYVSAVIGLGGRSLRAAPMVDTTGRKVGQVFVYDGSPSWVYVSVDGWGADGAYTLELHGLPAGPLSFPFTIAGGQGSMAHTASGDVSRLDGVRLVDERGHEFCRAVLPAS